MTSHALSEISVLYYDLWGDQASQRGKQIWLDLSQLGYIGPKLGYISPRLVKWALI